MKVEFDTEGKLVIFSENKTEAFALDRWAKENLQQYLTICEKVKPPKLVIDNSKVMVIKPDENV